MVQKEPKEFLPAFLDMEADITQHHLNKTLEALLKFYTGPIIPKKIPVEALGDVRISQYKLILPKCRIQVCLVRFIFCLNPLDGVRKVLFCWHRQSNQNECEIRV